MREIFSIFIKRSSRNFILSKLPTEVKEIRSLSSVVAHGLEENVTLEEIKNAVWSYVSEKAPGLFIRRYRDLLKEDIFASMEGFMAKARIPLGCSSSFINLIPKKIVWSP